MFNSQDYSHSLITFRIQELLRATNPDYGLPLGNSAAQTVRIDQRQCEGDSLRSSIHSENETLLVLESDASNSLAPGAVIVASLAVTNFQQEVNVNASACSNK